MRPRHVRKRPGNSKGDGNVRLSSVRARRLAAEFVLLVAGVLTALGVDAWWQGRTERVREAEYLDQLHEDALENRRRLAEALTIERDQLARADAVQRALRSRQPMDRDSATSWMIREPTFPWYSDPRVLTGTIVALVETGDINLIRQGDLRSAIIGYLGQLEADLAEFRRGIVPFQDHADRLYALAESARAAEPRAEREDAAQAYAVSPTDLLAVQRNPEAAVVFRLLRANIDNRIWYLSQMHEATEKFIGTLRP